MNDTPITKQISTVPVQTAGDISLTTDYLLTMDADDEMKLKRLTHEQARNKFLDNHIVGGGGQKAIITNDAEQTMTNKILDTCVLKGCTVSDGVGTPPLIEFIEGKVTQSVDEAMDDVSSGRAGYGTLFTAAYDVGVGSIPAADILADAGLAGYCIPVQNILALYLAASERIVFGSTAIESDTADIMGAGGNKINVPIIAAIEPPDEGLTLYLRYIPVEIAAGTP